MVNDHGRANSELKGLASRKGVELADQLDSVHAGKVDRLSKLEGDQFDKAYIDQMVKDHREDVAAFEKAAKTVNDAELKTFVVKTLPTLRAHLKHITAIESGKR